MTWSDVGRSGLGSTRQAGVIEPDPAQLTAPPPWRRMASAARPRSRRGRIRVQRVRRGVAAVLAGCAVWFGIGALSPPAPPVGVPALVALGELPVGSVLTADDLQVVHRPAEQLPEGVISDLDTALGQVLGGSLGTGEVLTARRLRSSAGLGSRPGTVSMSVPVASAGLLEVLQPGDRVVLFAPGTGTPAGVGTVQLARSGDSGGTTFGAGPPPLLLLALPAADAASVAAAQRPELGGGFVVAVCAPGLTDPSSCPDLG
ncbi:MAG: hypothetical protein CSA84_00670 [Actinomycetales bacterium]|nr:MAG: hypothetical protein CSA84_00670 [Actinomycetales bacterium]